MSNYAVTQDYFIQTTTWSHQMPSMHYHSSYELYYLEAGSREYFVGDKFFSVSAGSFVLIPPSKFHRTGGQYALRTLVGFTHEFLSRTFSQEAIQHLLKCFDNILITPPDNKQKECKTLLKALSKCKSETEFAIYLGVLLSELSKCTPENSYNKQMSDLIKYINKHFAEIESIEQIAQHFFISKYHLCRIFKNSLNITVIDYLNNVKIKNACKYLESTDKSIMEISQLCGFNSSTYFHNVFKKLPSLSPSEYRKRNSMEKGII